MWWLTGICVKSNITGQHPVEGMTNDAGQVWLIKRVTKFEFLSRDGLRSYSPTQDGCIVNRFSLWA